MNTFELIESNVKSYCRKYPTSYNSKIIENFLESEILCIDSRLKIRGLGMIWGIDFSGIDSKKALECVHKCFDNHLIIEVAGRNDSVLKIMPALTINEENLLSGLNNIKKVVKAVLE